MREAVIGAAVAVAAGCVGSGPAGSGEDVGSRADEVVEVAADSAPDAFRLDGFAFPPGFVWGVAMSAFQTEGGSDNDYTDWIAAGKSPEIGKACDSYVRYPEDVALAKGLGVSMMRVGIEWSRIEPQPGQWDMEAVEHYRDLLQEIRDAGMEPLVTLHHFTNPRWVANEGYWLWDGVVAEFEDYARLLAENLGDLVDHWNPMNEPMVYIDGWSLVMAFPGGQVGDFEAMGKVFYNVTSANAAAYDAIHEADPTGATVWLVHAVSPSYPDTPADPRSVDAARRFNEHYNHSFPRALVEGVMDLNLDGDTKDTVGGVQEGVFDSIKGRVDAIGINYYAREFVMDAPGIIPGVDAMPCIHGFLCGDPTGVKGDNGNEVYPPGIYDAIADFSRYGLPMYIAENGVADADDDLRPSYLVTHLMQVHRALVDGYDVRGYLHWSLLDNYEWTSGFDMKFGMFAVDFSTFERTGRGSADLYASIVAANRIPEEVVAQYDMPEINPMGPCARANGEPDAGCADGDVVAETGSPDRPPLTVMTFNSGTSLTPPPGVANEGFGPEQAAICDEWYGNGLSWNAFVEDVRKYIEEVDPDVVTFQEIFWCGECPGIPVEDHAGFVCEGWAPGDPTVAQRVLGDDFQVMCNVGKPDKCAAINHRIGSFRGCDSDFCIEGMYGSTVEGCGKGARIGRGVVDLVGGGVLTLVGIHASSGLAQDDMECRVKQFEQAFVDVGDGQPAANGEWNLLMGDLNTDPVLLADSDPSAARFLDFVGEGKPFQFVTDVGPESTPTYGGVMSIDHVVSDAWTGSCWAAGVTAGHPRVTESVAFDHRPVVCLLSPR
jgi:beta-glucosidase